MTRLIGIGWRQNEDEIYALSLSCERSKLSLIETEIPEPIKNVNRKKKNCLSSSLGVEWKFRIINYQWMWFGDSWEIVSAQIAQYQIQFSERTNWMATYLDRFAIAVSEWLTNEIELFLNVKPKSRNGIL